MSIFDEFNQEGIDALQPSNRTFSSPIFPDTSGNALDAIAFSGTESRFPEFPSPFGDTSIEEFIINLDEEDLVSRVENQPRTKFRVRFVPNESFFNDSLRPPEEHGIRLYVKLDDSIREKLRNEEIRLRKAVSRFSDSGISYRDVDQVYGVTLGKDIVSYIEEGEGQASRIAIRLANWMGLNPTSNEGYNFVAQITSSIRDFVNKFPNTRDVNPLEDGLSFFALLIELSVLDLINTAEFIASEVLKPLANEIRSWKLKEERWNARLGDKYDPLIKSPSRIRQELLQFFNDVDTNTRTQINTKIDGATDFVAIPKYSVADQKKSTKSSLLVWVDFLGDMLKGYFTNLEGYIDAVAENPEAPIELINAFLIGVINGVLDLLARLVGDIASFLELINPEKLNAFIEGIQQFIDQADFKTLEALFVKELRQLFSFLDGDDIYTNVYQMGVSIAKFVEIIINVYFGVKGVLRLGSAVIKVGKEIPEALKAFGNLVDELIGSIRFKSLTPGDIKKLKQLGIRLDVRSNTGLLVGIPVKKFEGKFHTVYYRNIVLERSTDLEKVEKLMKKFLDDPDSLSRFYRKERTNLLKTSPNFKIYIKEWKKSFSRYEKAPDVIDSDRILNDWFSNNRIRKKSLSKNRAQHFDDNYRQSKRILNNANIATGKIRLLTKKGKVIFERNDYLSHSGKGDRIPSDKEFPFGSIEKATTRFSGEKAKYHDTINTRDRYNDSENPLLRNMEEDAILAADRAKLDINDLIVEMIIETTYEPCIICKREMLLREQLLGSNTTIDVEFPIFPNGKGVQNNDELILFLKQ
ncbi:hypothetical protein [uncultured Dokdonia sp.]|uniref:hypothetical protein n=1 Tax=uncultured Dokdonia sp. TaxID=575653 RepID=UPI002617F3D2|nr:hypothetical protein [uncultured Dokdonia sp.]